MPDQVRGKTRRRRAAAATGRTGRPLARPHTRAPGRTRPDGPSGPSTTMASGPGDAAQQLAQGRPAAPAGGAAHHRAAQRPEGRGRPVAVAPGGDEDGEAVRRRQAGERRGVALAERPDLAAEGMAPRIDCPPRLVDAAQAERPVMEAIQASEDAAEGGPHEPRDHAAALQPARSGIRDPSAAGDSRRPLALDAAPGARAAAESVGNMPMRKDDCQPHASSVVLAGHRASYWLIGSSLSCHGAAHYRQRPPRRGARRPNGPGGA